MYAEIKLHLNDKYCFTDKQWSMAADWLTEYAMNAYPLRKNSSLKVEQLMKVQKCI